MQFDLTEDQRMLAGSAERWLADHAASPRNAERDWSAFAEMGWLALPFPAESGGLAGQPLDWGLLLQAMGRHLVAWPYASSLLVAGGLVDRLGNDAQRSVLADALEGRARLAFAHVEAGVPDPWARRRHPAVRDPAREGGWMLGGDKAFVDQAPAPTHWVVTARGQGDFEQVFLIEAQAGRQGAPYTTLDGGCAVDLRLAGLRLGADALLGDGSDAGPAIREALASGLIGQCWAAAGVIDALVTATAAYVSGRQQFGKRLADFQAVQHQLAEMEVERLEARAACELASLRLARGEDGRLLASGTKVRVAAAADLVSKRAIQLHGAMGVCEELGIAPSFRWLAAFQARWGSAALHARWLGQQQRVQGRLARSSVLEDA